MKLQAQTARIFQIQIYLIMHSILLLLSQDSLTIVFFFKSMWTQKPLLVASSTISQNFLFINDALGTFCLIFAQHSVAFSMNATKYSIWAYVRVIVFTVAFWNSKPSTFSTFKLLYQKDFDESFFFHSALLL